MDVVLRGYSGYNTRWALKVLDKVFPPEMASVAAPAAITVFFGANDACLPDRSSAFAHVTMDEYKENLKTMVSFFNKRWPGTTILLITPPIDEDGRLRHPFGNDTLGLPERTNEAAGNYARACFDAAKEYGVLVVDLWSKMQRLPGWKRTYLRDGLHLTKSGNRVVFYEVKAKLREAGLSLKALKVDLPRLFEIDPTDPLKTFQKL